MSTYLELKGGNVKRVDSDPANPKFGQVWYNDTANQIKVTTTILAAWGSGGNLGTARERLGAAGTQTAGLAFGGFSSPVGNLNNTEEFTNTTEFSNKLDVS
jgi:hypothetical protein